MHPVDSIERPGAEPYCRYYANSGAGGRPDNDYNGVSCDPSPDPNFKAFSVSVNTRLTTPLTTIEVFWKRNCQSPPSSQSFDVTTGTVNFPETIMPIEEWTKGLPVLSYRSRPPAAHSKLLRRKRALSGTSDTP